MKNFNSHYSQKKKIMKFTFFFLTGLDDILSLELITKANDQFIPPLEPWQSHLLQNHRDPQQKLKFGGSGRRGNKHQRYNYEMFIGPICINLFCLLTNFDTFTLYKTWLLCIIYIMQRPIQLSIFLPTERINCILSRLCPLALYMYKHNQLVTK